MKRLILTWCVTLCFSIGVWSCENQNVQCTNECSSGYNIDANGCRTCECAGAQGDTCQGIDCGDDENKICKLFDMSGRRSKRRRCVDRYIPTPCQMPADRGMCRARIARYWFDADSGECRRFYYGGCQGNRNNFRTWKDCIFTCIPSANPSSSDERVKKAALTDDHQCSNVQCFMECDFGFRQDTYGCDICECRTVDEDYAAVCGNAQCLMECDYGFRRDDFGCDICECQTLEEHRDSCDIKQCLMECQYGFKRDESDCDVCECRTVDEYVELCGAQQCMMECENGFTQDVNGCFQCKCVENPIPDTTNDCSALNCLMECPNGFEKDTMGCTVCKCVENVTQVCGLEECLMECENGFKKDQMGCNVCECAPICGAEECFVLCLSGFQTDENGCTVCKCLDNGNQTQVKCGNQMCAIECPAGFKQDENGCNACECNPEVVQPHVCGNEMCLMLCPAGFKIDEFGCDICECQEEKVDEKFSCPLQQCLMECEFGFKKDNRNCDVCECAESQHVCPRLRCLKNCVSGLIKDEFGCELCECSDPSLEPAPCSKVPCTNRCRLGYQTTDAGCYTCECVEAPGPCGDSCNEDSTCRIKINDDGFMVTTCVSLLDKRPWCENRPECMNFCENGYRRGPDGCEECACRQVPGLPCLALDCARTVDCPFGQDYNENGCITCDCLENPCLGVTCPESEVCEAQAYEKCTSCPYHPTCISGDLVRTIHVQLMFVTSAHISALWGESEITIQRMKEQLAEFFDVAITDFRILNANIDRNIDETETQIRLDFNIVADRSDLAVMRAQYLQSDVSAAVKEIRLTSPADPPQEITLIPDPATLQMSYHSTVSDDDVEEEDCPNGSQRLKTTLIIFLVMCALLLIVTVLACVLRRQDKKNRENHAYKMAPSSA